MTSFTPRLYIPLPLEKDNVLPLTVLQTHYLIHVMRLKPEKQVNVFNGKDGEWASILINISKKDWGLKCVKQRRTQTTEFDLWLAFAPLKKAGQERLIAQATELGISRFIPVETTYSSTHTYQTSKTLSYAIEAAEQSEQLHVPVVAPLSRLEKFLQAWPVDRTLYVCMERDTLPCLWDSLETPIGKAAFLIGPEGGFSATEQDQIKNFPFAKRVSLGPSVLRAETAATVAIGCFVQKMCLEQVNLEKR